MEKKCAVCGHSNEDELYECPYCKKYFCSKHITPTIDKFIYGHKCEEYINNVKSMRLERPIEIKINSKPNIKYKEIYNEIWLLIKYGIKFIILIFLILVILRLFKI